MKTDLFGSASLLACVFPLAACSGGGGGASAAPVPPSTATVIVANLGGPDAVVSAPQDASMHGNSPLLATASTPNFTSSPPSNGTAFPLNETVLKEEFGKGQVPTTVTGFTNSLPGGTTLTWQGSQLVNGTPKNIYQLKIPDLSVDAANLVSGTTSILPNGLVVTVSAGTLSYALLSSWSVAFTSNSTFSGLGVTGFQTPNLGVPASGTATYVGTPSNNIPISGLTSSTGGVYGLVFVPSSTFVNGGELNGRASVNVNFATSAVTGSLTNMTASFLDGPLSTWNDVALSGSLTGASVRGTTSVTTTPSTAWALGPGATGSFSGALFGPNAQELGISWTLYDPSGKSAIGVVGAIKP